MTDTISMPPSFSNQPPMGQPMAPTGVQMPPPQPMMMAAPPMGQPMQPMQPMNYPPQQTSPSVVVVQTGASNNYLSCGNIMCGCEAPNFNCCQCPIGFFTTITGGGCLSAGTFWCCYGCSRPDCCNVYCAGCGLVWTSPFIYGIVASCIVGCKMMTL